KINADYSQIFKGMNLTAGPISHGETGEAAQSLHNMNNYVFSSSEGNAAMDIIKNPLEYSVYPNPSNGNFKVRTNQKGQYQVIDMLGRTVETGSLKEGVNTVFVRPAGLYVLRIQASNGHVKTTKLHNR
ncbi:MAG: T9SS type A sorting domain-containing protein, partial [Flavobacteriales bacterium]